MDARDKLVSDYTQFTTGLPRPLEAYILEEYQISLASEYGGIAIKNPFGKASGQLSLNAKQVERDAEAGLGFVVLKTVIAEDETGGQSMKAWAIPATHMTIEEIRGTRTEVLGKQGWTVTWKGRGWSESFANYLAFFDKSLETSTNAKMLVVPSAKYHLPRPDENVWRVSEYEYTTRKLVDGWRTHHSSLMPLEKDFSPTLAGDQNFSRERANILEWLRRVPEIVKSTSVGSTVRLGLKLFNAAFSDDFQSEMLNACAMAGVPADFLIYGNRLFDPSKEYEGTRGVAYGGPDLSARNLAVLSQWKQRLPFSATGNIATGRTAFDYLRQGASSFQMHTLFQLPDNEFEMKGSSRTERALHRLLFHPDHGFLAALLEEKTKRNWQDGITVKEISQDLTSQ